MEISLSVLSFFRRFGLNRGGGSGGSPSVTGGGGPSSFGIWRHVGYCVYSPVFYGLQVLVGRSPSTGLGQESFLQPHPHSPFHGCRFRVYSLPLSTNSCGWVRSPSRIWVIMPGIVSFVESCVKSHWLCVPTTPSGEGCHLQEVLSQVNQTCVLCYVLPLLVVVLKCHVSPHAPKILPYLTYRRRLTTSDRDIRQSDDLARYSYSK